MAVEILVATMNQNDHSLIDKMNLKGKATIINQCKFNKIDKLQLNDDEVNFISCTDRGLSKSRNKAIENASSDICVIADDDLRYNDNYKDIILEAYKKYPDADIIAFDVPSTNPERPTSVQTEGYLNYLKTMKIASFQITFKRKSIIDNKIKFKEDFGAGAKYSMGEENIFLFSCLRKGLKIVYCSEKIAIVNHAETTWFNGFTEKFFTDMGAIYYEMSSKYSNLLIYQYALRKHKLYKNEISFFKALSSMLNGKKNYIKSL